MIKFLIAVAAWKIYIVIYGLMRWAPDSLVLSLLDATAFVVRSVSPRAFLLTVLSDTRKIFVRPGMSRLARRMVVESRGAQVRAVIRGALKGACHV